jgi:general secretion pathway protein G
MKIHPQRAFRTAGSAETGRRLREGFSLAEMMVVIVIIGLLATLVVPNVIQKLNNAMRGKVKSDIMAIDSALKEYYINNGGRYPDTLEALVTPDENGHTYLDQRSIPLDPWKNEYMYEPPASGEPRPRVYSYGKDGQPGGEGDEADVDNWSIVEGKGK